MVTRSQVAVNIFCDGMSFMNTFENNFIFLVKGYGNFYYVMNVMGSIVQAYLYSIKIPFIKPKINLPISNILENNLFNLIPLV